VRSRRASSNFNQPAKSEDVKKNKLPGLTTLSELELNALDDPTVCEWLDWINNKLEQHRELTKDEKRVWHYLLRRENERERRRRANAARLLDEVK